MLTLDTMRIVSHALRAVVCFLFLGLGAIKARAANGPKVEGFELLGSVGYGFALEELDRKNQRAEWKNPYGVLLGLNGGYSWASGLRLGLDVQCGFGAYACSSITAGPSVAYDLVFSSWRFRGSFDTGVWYGYVPFIIFAAPGAALIWQHGDFELGLGTRYVISPIDSIQPTLMSGVRF